MNEVDFKELSPTFKADFDIIRTLQQKHKELEEKVYNSRSDTSEVEINNSQSENKFKSHPKRLNTNKNKSDKVSKLTTVSATDVELTKFYQERKIKTYGIRTKLHEKLSLINPSDHDMEVNSHVIGDSCYNSPKSYPSPKDYCLDNSDVESIESKKDNSDIEIPPFKKGAILDTKLNLPNQKLSAKSNIGTVKSSKNSSVQSSQRSLSGIGVFETKLRTYVEKCLAAFGEIRLNIEKGVALPDGEEDAARRTNRLKEFSNRFSRNYLYPLEIQLKELRELGYRENYKLSNQHVKQKLLSTYQTILYGLQAYQTHIPTSVGNCASDKLNILIGHTLDICRIHRELMEHCGDNWLKDFIETFKLNAELTQQKIKEFFFAKSRIKSTDSVLRSNETRTSLGQYGDGKTAKTKNKKSAMEKRLSMYSATASFRKDAQWKMAVDNLAKRKFNVKSKYKTATYKHRPPVLKDFEIIPLPTTNIKLCTKKSSGILKNTPIVSPKNEDNIETMVQVVGLTDRSGTIDDDDMNEGQSKKDHVQSDLVIKLLQLVLNSKDEKENNNERSNEEIFELMDKIKAEGNGGILQDILEDLKNNKYTGSRGNQLILNIVKSREGTARNVKTRKEPKVTSITGDRNARLICITDENSIQESDDDEQNVKPKVCSSKTQTSTLDCQNDKNKEDENAGLNAKSVVRISRLQKSGKPLQVLPKELALGVIQYKLEFYKHSKNNPMYKKTSNCRQPCDLMNRVSDNLLDQCLLEVAREIEINDVIDTIYQSELQL